MNLTPSINKIKNKRTNVFYQNKYKTYENKGVFIQTNLILTGRLHFLSYLKKILV